MSLRYAPEDTVRVTANDVTQRDVDSIKIPVTSGLNGTLDVETWKDRTHVSGPFTLIHGTGQDDWYFDLTAPSTVGRYRLVVVLEVGGAQKTLYGELNVEDE